MTDRPDLERLTAASADDALLNFALIGLPPDRRARVVVDVVAAMVAAEDEWLTLRLAKAVAEVLAALPPDQRREVLRRVDDLAAGLAERLPPTD